MAIFANGPDYQSYSISSTTPTVIFYTRGVGGTAIAANVTVHNPMVVNAGTVALYVGGGTVAAAGATPTAAFLLGTGIVLQPGQQMVIFGTAVTGTATTAGLGIYDMYGCVSSGSTFVESSYATQAIVS